MKDLLIKLREYIEDSDNIFTGMCLSVMLMESEKVINGKEFKELRKFIAKEGKKEERSIGNYWWIDGDKKPRLQWLNEKIAELDK